MIVSAIILWTIITIIIILALHFRKIEIKKFNNGICDCGGKFENFDMDSQGGLGWQCNKCGKYIWTSWVKRR